MGERFIPVNVERKLYAESMGRCMNPNCQRVLFSKNGDIMEKAHIVPHCETKNSSFENLVVLCPNCHTDYDKNGAFKEEELLEWKKIRSEELDAFFRERFTTFDELRKKVAPLLERNKAIFENYYLSGNKELWGKFEIELLVNNRMLKGLFLANKDLFQKHTEGEYSNYESMRQFIAHVDEFEATRCDGELVKQVLFPPVIDSMFGIKPVKDSLFPSTESLELLIQALNDEGRFKRINLGIECPSFQMIQDGEVVAVNLDDTPRLRQLYDQYKCFRKPGVRIDSLNYALKYIKSKGLSFEFLAVGNLREIRLRDIRMRFVYEYCLSRLFLIQSAPETNSVVVNLHNWNGESCISKDAYNAAEAMGVTLLTMNAFYKFVRSLAEK